MYENDENENFLKDYFFLNNSDRLINIDNYDLSFEINEFKEDKINYTTTKDISKEKTLKELKENGSIKDVSLNLEMNDEEKKIKKKCGRKRKREISDDEKVPNVHNKHSSDNLIRKCKHLVIKSLYIFLNKEIYLEYMGNIGNGPLKKEFQTLNQSQISNAKIDFNKKFLSKTVGEIFSENISGRITNYPLEHNKLLVIRLINEKNENIRNHFKKIFNLKFIECLEHFIGKKRIDILKDLKCYENVKEKIIEKYEDGKEYSDNLETFFNNYEKMINNKRGRTIRKNYQ